MVVYYRLMGIIAAMCSRMSRYRVNGIPSHLSIIFFCGIFLMIFSDIQLRDAPVYGKPPKNVSIADLLATGKRNQYVTVTGPVAPDLEIVTRQDGKENTYLPMYDDRSRRAMLILSTNAVAPGITPPNVYTGMLRQLPSDLAKGIRNDGGRVGKYEVLTAYQLHAGDTPLNPKNYYYTALLLGLPLLLMLVTVLNKHIVFQKTAIPHMRLANETASGPLPENMVMRITGRLALGEKVSQRFLDMPVVLAKASDGEMAFLSKINASIKQEFGAVIDRAGWWAAVVKDGRITVGDEGLLYAGLKVRPALRVRFTDKTLKKPYSANAVLSFDTVEERDRVRLALQSGASPV